MSSPTIAESMQKKDELRKAIADLVTKFSKETGLIVDSIDVRHVEVVGGFSGRYTVNIEVKLP